MMKNLLRVQRLVAVWALCATVVLMYSGCAPLKKKFTRQKKKDKETSSDFVPVLEPEVYPAKTVGPAEIYTQQYNLLKVWISDFADNHETIKNDKRMVADLDAALKVMREMISQLGGPASDDVTAVKNQIEWIREEFLKPASFRNVSRINGELRDVERNIKKFKPNLVLEHFKVQ